MPPAGPNVTVQLDQLANKSHTEVYEHRMGLIVMMNEIGVGTNERKKIFTDGFESVEELVNHFVDDVDGFRKYLEMVNKNSAANPNASVYFRPPVMRRFIGALYYLNTVVHGMHKIPDILQISKEMAETYADQYKTFGKDDDSDDDTEDLIIPKLTDAASWVPFRDAFISKLSNITGSRGFTLDYVIDVTERHATHPNDIRIEVNDVDLEMEHVFTQNVTHFGRSFKKDNKAVWSRLRNLLINTNPYTHISNFHTSSNGRAAWLALRSIYEGEDFKQRNQEKAFSQLSETFYKGETSRFSFEKYVFIHKQAHKLLLDSGYNNGQGMDEASKIHHFKARIRPEAGLESALSQIRSNPTTYNDFTRLTAYLQAEVEHHSIRKQQLKGDGTRNVSGVGSGKGGGKPSHKNGGGKPHNPSNKNIPSKMVDGKRVYGRHYPANEFKAFSQSQRA